MSDITASATTVLRDLGDGLILRAGRIEDTELLAEFNAFIFRNRETNEPNQGGAWWTRDLVLRHPTVRPSDFTVVEDTSSGKIVSSLVWISQRWSYRDIPFGVGRPELVGTHPDYRGRGLMRAQFELAHEWSAQRGEMLQAITGIPYFYRRFGYEMTVELGAGRACHSHHIPKLKPTESEPFRVRPATRADLPFIRELCKLREQRSLVNCLREEREWLYELEGMSEKNDNHMVFVIVEALDGEVLGFLAHMAQAWGRVLGTQLFELKPGKSWVAISPSVLRYLWATGETYVTRAKKENLTELVFRLGSEHPFFTAMRDHLPQTWNPYAWYIRVPNIAAFLRHIAAVLEHRLAESVVAGHSGELKLSFYRKGVHMTFEHGHLTSAVPWQPQPHEEGDAGFPDLTFLQLLFGYRSLEELRYAWPDCWVNSDATRALLEALFPRQVSHVWPIA